MPELVETESPLEEEDAEVAAGHLTVSVEVCGRGPGPPLEEEDAEVAAIDHAVAIDVPEAALAEVDSPIAIRVDQIPSCDLDHIDDTAAIAIDASVAADHRPEFDDVAGDGGLPIAAVPDGVEKQWLPSAPDPCAE